jgi:hypothetical protein
MVNTRKDKKRRLEVRRQDCKRNRPKTSNANCLLFSHDPKRACDPVAALRAYRLLRTGGFEWLPCKPSKDARPSQCTENVIHRIDSEGGRLVAGWSVWDMDIQSAERSIIVPWLVGHCVWQPNRKSTLLDVTPRVKRPMLRYRGFFRDPTLSGVFHAESVWIIDSPEHMDLVTSTVTDGDQMYLLDLADCRIGEVGIKTAGVVLKANRTLVTETCESRNG